MRSLNGMAASPFVAEFPELMMETIEINHPGENIKLMICCLGRTLQIKFSVELLYAERLTMLAGWLAIWSTHKAKQTNQNPSNLFDMFFYALHVSSEFKPNYTAVSPAAKPNRTPL